MDLLGAQSDGDYDTDFPMPCLSPSLGRCIPGPSRCSYHTMGFHFLNRLQRVAIIIFTLVEEAMEGAIEGFRVPPGARAGFASCFFCSTGMFPRTRETPAPDSACVKVYLQVMDFVI